MTKRPRARRETKVKKMSTKIEPLPGALDSRMVRCGKPNCRCAGGELHGPYYVRRWRSDGQRSSVYVRKRDVPAVKRAVETYRQERRQDRRRMQEAMLAFRLIYRRLRGMLSEGEL